ncbi:MAG: DUF3857 domain-containing protein [Bacteroidales bacterium]|nr:DUF3857 domain-containing protein [Bacteroidales bacterium]
MKPISLIVGLFVMLQLVSAQKAPLKFGKPGEDELNIIEHHGAPAVVLYDFGQYYLDGRIGRVFFYYKRHLRIKILSEEGLKYARQTIFYYDLTKATYFSNSQSYELRAQTLNTTDNGKIVKTRLKSKDIIRSGVYSDFNTDITLVFPNVKVGSIIEYEINIPTINLVNPPIWAMQFEIPVLWSELRVITPLDFDYSAKIYNTDYIDINEESSFVTSMSYPRGGLTYSANQLRFVKTNIAALPDTMLSKGVYLKIMLEYASRKFALPGMEELFKALDANYKYLDKSEKGSALHNTGYLLYKRPDLSGIAGKLMKDPGFGPPLVINMGFNDSLKSITASSKSQTEKMDTVFSYVSNNFEWDGNYRVFVRDGFSVKTTEFISRFASENANLNTSLSKSMRTHSGSGSEINFILINLLNSAGVKTYPVLVSTLDFDLIDTAFFNLHQFNHVIALAEADGQHYLLDAVKNGENYVLTSKPLNDFGLVIYKDRAEWIAIKP